MLHVVRLWIVDFKIKFCKYYLMIAVLVKRRVNSQIHCQNWLRGEEKIDTECRFSLIVSQFITNLSNWEVMFSVLESSKVVISALYQLWDFALWLMTKIKEGIASYHQTEIALRVSSKLSEVFKVIFGLVWQPVQRNKFYLQFLSKILYIHESTEYWLVL